ACTYGWPWNVVLNLLLAAFSGPAEDVDGALTQRHDRALGVLALAHPEPGPAALALPGRGVDGLDLDVEDLLDRDLDLGLVRPGVHQEGVLTLVEQVVTLLRDHRGQDDVPGVLVRGRDAHWSSSVVSASVVPAEPPAAAGPETNASRASVVKTTSSETRTS